MKRIATAISVLTFLSLWAATTDATTPIFHYQNAFNLSSKYKIKKSENPSPIQRTDPSPLLPIQNQKRYQIQLKNSDPIKIIQTIRPLFPGVLMSPDERTRSILLSTTESTYDDILNIVTNLDQKLTQLKLSIEIIEVSTQNLSITKGLLSDLNTGLAWNYSVKENKIVPASDIIAHLDYLESIGQARVLAKPSITTLENIPCTIHVGDRIPYLTTVIQNNFQTQTVQFLETGIELKLYPRITENAVDTEIEAEIAAVKLWKTLNDKNEYPILSNRKTKTRVVIENQKTLILAGLLDETQKITHSEIPGLASIPFLGEAFKSHQTEVIQSDIVFLITPEIITTE